MGHTSSITISYSNLNRSDTSGKPYIPIVTVSYVNGGGTRCIHYQ